MQTRQDRPNPTPRARPTRGPRPAFLWLALLAVGLIVVAGSWNSTAAEPAAAVDVVYISVTSEGPSAKAWYDGAPSPGVPVQEALTKFASQGYKVVEMTHDLRATQDSSSLIILLQRVR